ncbi:uncharacterized protein EMH_0011460 [Eimeria mitis]|uniref:Uncharacterized protein n=1 Tax=Eimeria mitis TaxID=44415 RepID=U6JWM6_9EIME|nr:uncharacterized protein EMH_0011460 [Eimeria mitis]CDJ27918.1 hypothetical protein EMH_0011460 [Eimeria mitis]
MQIAAAAEPGGHRTSLFYGSQSSWEVTPGEVVLPVISRSLPQRRIAGVGGLTVSVAAVAAVVAIAASYFVVRCALYLSNARKRRASLRFLAGAEGKTNNDQGDPCGTSAGDPPAAAAASVDEEKTDETLDEQDLLEQAGRYVFELTRVMERNGWLLTQLNFSLRARCVAIFLCVCLVELAALFSLLDKRERVGMKRGIHLISATVVDLRRSLGRAPLSPSRRRHIRFLHELVDQLATVPPPTAVLERSQRLLRIKELLQLQEVALGQLKAGLGWLSACLENCKETQDVGKAPAEFIEDTVAAAEGAAAAGAAAAAPYAPTSAAAGRVDAVVAALQTTAYKRREQVLRDASLSRWLREVHGPDSRHGLVSKGRLAQLALKPLQSHSERLAALQATPLGSGDELWKSIGLEEIDVQQGSASPCLPDAPCQEVTASTWASPNPSPCALGPLDTPRQDSRKEAGSTGSVLVSSSASTAETAASADAVVEQHAALEATNDSKTVPLAMSPNILSRASPPAAAGRRQSPAVFTDPEPPAAASASDRIPQAKWPSRGSGIAGVATRAPVASAGRLDSVPPRGAGPYSAVPHPSPATFTPPPSSWRSPKGATVSRLPPKTFATHFRPRFQWPRPDDFTAAEAGASLLRTREADASPLQSVAEYSTSAVEISASQPLFTTHWTAEESRSSLAETKVLENWVDVRGRPNIYRLWGPQEQALYTPVAGSLSSERTDEPSLAEISAGFQRLAVLFSGEPDQTLSATVHRGHLEVAGAPPAANAAASATGGQASPALSNSGEELFTWMAPF